MDHNEWTPADLENLWQDVRKIATDKFGLQFNEPAFEIVTFEDMLRIFSTSLPVCYNHWSFGKKYLEYHDHYKANLTGMAAEVIFNTDPAICYLADNNSYTLQALVIAHAAIGHSSFNKNNYLFKEHTSPHTIVPFLKNFRQLINQYEKEYGEEEVEKVLDACHALEWNAVNHYKNKNKKSSPFEIKVQLSLEKDQNISRATNALGYKEKRRILSKNRLHEENILAFIGQYSPVLRPWQREIIQKFCSIRQYLYPQILTKTMNEGFATFWQYEIGRELYDQGKLTDGQFIEFLTFQSQLVTQRPFNSKGYGGFNPYALGYAIFTDIKRICTNPTEEDKRFFPDLVGKDWIEEVKWAAYNYKDSSFIQQYLSPQVMRNLQLFSLYTDEDLEHYKVTEIHDDEGYIKLRAELAKQQDIIQMFPHIYVEGWDPKKSRSLFLVIELANDRKLTNESLQVFKYIKQLWPYPIYLKGKKEDGTEEQIEVRFDD